MSKYFTLAYVSYFFLFSLFFLSLIFYFLDIAQLLIPGQIIFMVALATAFFYSIYLHPKIIDGVKVFLLFLIIFSTCIFSSGFFIDGSYDGQGYHLAKVRALKEGWNPIYQNIFDMPDFISYNLAFIQSYPTLSSIWVFHIYQLTGNVEFGKGISIFLAILSILFLYQAMAYIIPNKFLNFLFVLISVLNPVTLVQIFTFGVDSILYSLFLILVSTGIFIYKKIDVEQNFFILFITIVFILNIKLTGIFYLLFFLSFYIGYLVYRFYFTEKIFLLRIICVVLVSVISGIFIFGYQPYVTNITLYGQAFYPAYVTSSSPLNAFDYSENRPSNFINEDPTILFFKSLFFKVNGEFQPPNDYAEYKFPLTFSQSELDSFVYLGPKIGGFGVFFGGIVLLLIILFGFALYELYVQKGMMDRKDDLLILLLCVTAILLSTLLNPLNSVARYVSQFWFIIPVVLLFTWKIFGWQTYILNIVILLLVIINSTFILNTSFNSSIQYTEIVRKNILYLKNQSQQKPILVNFGQSEGNIFLLDYYGVKYERAGEDARLFRCFFPEKRVSLLGGVGNSVAFGCLR